MNEKDENPEPVENTDSLALDSGDSNELDDRDLDSVAGGIAWHPATGRTHDRWDDQPSTGATNH